MIFKNFLRIVLFWLYINIEKMKEMWDSRYSEEGFAYGEEPNIYLKEKIRKLDRGNILFPAEGEGRNAVYAARLGWEVEAFDQSSKGKEKALLLAMEHKVNINYQVGELSQVSYAKDSFDVLSLIYAHFPPTARQKYHQHLSDYLKKGAYIILEGFSKNNLELNKHQEASNGPKNLEMLFSKEMIKNDFPGFEIIELKEQLINLDEGKYHQGKASVIRFMGRKL